MGNDIQDYFLLVAEGIKIFVNLLAKLRLNFMGVELTLEKIIGLAVVTAVMGTLLRPHDEFEDFFP